MQHMADDARRNDDQLVAMLSRMNAKDKQMTNLIAQITTMSIRRRNNDNNANPSTCAIPSAKQRTAEPAEETAAIKETHGSK